MIRQLRAIIVDSLRESVDRKSLLVMLALSLVPIVFCASLRLEGAHAEDVLETQARDLATFRWSSGHSRVSQGNDTKVEVLEARRVDAGEFGAALDGGRVVTIEFPAATSADRLAAAWAAFGRPRAGGPANTEAPTARQFLIERFAQNGWEDVDARQVDDKIWQVAVRTDYPDEVAGGFIVTAGFGAVELPVKHTTLVEFMIGLLGVLIGAFVGFIGMVVAISACAGFVPSMLHKGTLDLALARPISRPVLLLGKYVGGLWFVAGLATVAIGGCWLALALGPGYANPWILLGIPAVLASFAVLYSVTVLVGVVTRSTAVATLASLALWFVATTVGNIRELLRAPLPKAVEIADWARNLVESAYWVLPKMGDFGHAMTLGLARSHRSDAARARVSTSMPEVDWVFSLSSTGLFAAAVLGLAVWWFQRRDY